MIAKEQAEQAFREQWKHPDFEVRIVDLTQGKSSEVTDNDGTSLGVFEIEEDAWRCTYEMRRKILDRGKWTGRWIEWKCDVCYIVEPKPGPYVVDRQY